MVDVFIVGAGPAGLTAAVYARRSQKTVLVMEKATFGGQITYSPCVENYPGFDKISGNAFGEKLIENAMAQGAELALGEVLAIEKTSEGFLVKTDDGDKMARSVILATGCTHRLLGVPGEEKFMGDGVSFCAVCDGAFYKDRHIVLVGGGNTALQEALLLSSLCKQVTILQNLPCFTGEKALVSAVGSKENVDVHFEATVRAFEGEKTVTGVTYTNAKGEQTTIACDGVFLAVGQIPQNKPFASFLEVDKNGYAISGEDCLTRTEGVFVAGDCRQKKVRQLTTAVSDGAIAALEAIHFLDR